MQTVHFIGFLICVLFLGCRHPESKKDLSWKMDPSWRMRATSFAISRPDHVEDCFQLQKKLNAKNLRIAPGRWGLGMVEMDVDSEQFDLARNFSAAIISRYSLTVAIQKTSAKKNTILEEYKNGRKVGETDYGVSDEK